MNPHLGQLQPLRLDRDCRPTTPGKRDPTHQYIAPKHILPAGYRAGDLLGLELAQTRDGGCRLDLSLSAYPQSIVEYLHPPDPGEDVVLTEYDLAWPLLFEQMRRLIVEALGRRAIEVHHAGSTSVPGLAAKPVIDIVLVVADPARESDYEPLLATAGFQLHAREPEWWEHRIFKSSSPRANLHVFAADCPEVTRMLAFRDHLRRDNADLALYERTKRELAARRWDRVQDYADAKTDVVAAIMSRAVG